MNETLSFARTANCRANVDVAGGAKGNNTKGQYMKLQIKILIAALALAGSAAYLIAQDNNGTPPFRRGPGPRAGFGAEGRRMPPSPLLRVLDANHDGVIDATEIDNAPAALRTLDKNGDGKLTMDELRPPRPEGRGPAREGGPDNPPAEPPPAN